jgi:RNA polymerase sigma-70 factor (ECF subfamily)
VDAATIEGFRAGDQAAVRTVFQAYGRLVFTVALRVLGDRGLAEDATQQTFVQAWRAAAAFDPGRELGPWLATIARRAAIDVQRREAIRAPRPVADMTARDAPSAAETAERAYEAWAVRQAVDELPGDERDVVRLQHLEGKSHTEIAEQLGIPIGTVKSRSNRAHRRLASRLGYLRETAG